MLHIRNTLHKHKYLENGTLSTLLHFLHLSVALLKGVHPPDTAARIVARL